MKRVRIDLLVVLLPGRILQMWSGSPLHRPRAGALHDERDCIEPIAAKTLPE